MSICFSQAQLEAIAVALGDTKEGLTNSEIEHLLATCKIGWSYRQRLGRAEDG
jgi:hypothetical protein